MKERFVLKIYIPVKLETNLFSRLSDYSFKRILKAVSIAKLSKDRSPSSRNIVVVVVVVIVVNRIHINLSLVTAKFPNRVSSSGRSYRCINSTSRFQVHIYIHTHTYIYAHVRYIHTESVLETRNRECLRGKEGRVPLPRAAWFSVQRRGGTRVSQGR